MREKLGAWNETDKKVKDSNVVGNRRHVRRLTKHFDRKRGKHAKTGCVEAARVVKQERDIREHTATMQKSYSAA